MPAEIPKSTNSEWITYSSVSEAARIFIPTHCAIHSNNRVTHETNTIVDPSN